jgi:hypothetical protein
MHNTNDENEVVYGYFEVGKLNITRYFLIPAWIPYYVPPYCDFDYQKPYDRYPKECVRCDAQNSIERPEWF